jgi:hypothetical protein
MNGRGFVRGAILSLAVVILPMQLWSACWCAAEVAAKPEDVEVTPSLVREIQFMLLRLGMEPGPIDGVIGPQTTRAWRKFQQDTGLQEGFDGSTARAVSMLKDRLNEARQIAGNIGGSALTEVQRQSRVLDYFTCRLKIEQESQR